MNYLVVVLYLISFAMFIYGLMGLTGPKTAVRGNWIAAVGMAIAVVATLIKIRDTESWPLIIAGLLLGVVLGTFLAFYGTYKMVATFMAGQQDSENGKGRSR